MIHPARSRAARLRTLLGTVMLGLAVWVPHAVASEIPTLEAVTGTLAELEGQLEEARKRSGEAGLREVDVLERWRGLLVDQVAALRQRDELATRKNGGGPDDDLDGQLAAGPPYSLELFDRALDRLEGTSREFTELSAAEENARDSLEAARLELEKAEKARRRAKEDNAPDLPQKVRAARIAEARATLQQIQVENASRRAALLQEWLAANESLPERLFRGVQVSDEDRTHALERFDSAEAELRRRLERATLEQQEAESRWKAFQERLAGGQGTREETALYRARLSYRQKAVALLTEQLERVRLQRAAEQARLEVLVGDQDRQTLLERVEKSRAAVEEWKRARSLDRAGIAALEQDLAALGAREAGTADGVRGEHADVLRARIALEKSNLASIGAAIAAEERLRRVIAMQAGDRTLRDRIEAGYHAVRDVWSYELFASEDRPVTVGKVIAALALIVIGLAFARFARAILERRVLPRLGLDEGASHAFAVLAFYGLIVGIVLFSLQTVSIPLTAFAVAGGAVAIGVGFGSQNVVNNFISGIILLAERPIKVGDLVEVNNTYGNVQHIGARSTSIRTGSNIHVIVPNSTFLESNVVNWTHNDPKVRISVSVGVAYGSPTREVEAGIRQALAEHEKVLQTPKPIVLFEEFGDNSLNFSAHFWVQVKAMMDRLRIESDLRFRIDDLFREADITIAFPQRDVHLDTLSPLDVRVRLDSDDAPGPPKES